MVTDSLKQHGARYAAHAFPDRHPSSSSCSIILTPPNIATFNLINSLDHILEMGSLGTMPVNERPPLGLIASAMNIHRAPGDVGCQRTFDFPLIQENTEGALLVSMVSDHDYDEELLDRFVATGQKLIDRGAVGLVSSCGFLALAQKT